MTEEVERGKKEVREKQGNKDEGQVLVLSR